MVVVAQLVRVVVCGAAGRRFEPGQPPNFSKASSFLGAFFVLKVYSASLHQFVPKFRDSSQVSGFKYQVSGFKFQVSSFRFQVSSLFC